MSLTASRLGKTEPFAVSHLKLMKEDGTTIEDNIHELFVFKVTNSPLSLFFYSIYLSPCLCPCGVVP